MIVDTSSKLFPERKVTVAATVDIDTLAYQMGHRWNLKLECGHIVVSKNTVPCGIVKCIHCRTEADS